MKTDQDAFKSNDGIFSTRDLALAATLMTLRFPLLGIDYQIEGLRSRPIGYFKFEHTPAIDEAKRKYMQSLIMVIPQSYDQAKEALKSEVMNVRLNPSTGMDTWEATKK